MGAMFIGVIVSAILYGISLIQTLYYYSRTPIALYTLTNY